MLRNRSRTRTNVRPWYLEYKADDENPSLILQFNLQRYAANNRPSNFSDVLTFTRSTTATYFDAGGLMKSAAIDTPRFYYDPATGAAMGLLIEGQRTNLALYSNPTSGQGGVTNGTRSFNNTTTNDLWGTTTSCRVTASATASVQHFASGNTISFTSGTAYTLSAFVKAGTVSRVQLTATGSAFGTSQYANFELSGAGSVLASAGGSAGIKQLSNGWYRVWLTVTATSTSSGAGLILAFIDSDTATRIPSYTAAGTETFFYDGQQVEEGNFPSSYIPTTASAETRAADIATITASTVVPFADWYNQTEGAFYIDCYKEFATAPAGSSFLQSSDGTTSNRIALLASTSDDDFVFFVVNGGATQCSIDSTTDPVGGRKKAAAAYKLNDAALAATGVGVSTDASITIPTTDRLSIGTSTGATTDFMYGHIREIRYYASRVSDSELQRVVEI